MSQVVLLGICQAPYNSGVETQGARVARCDFPDITHPDCSASDRAIAPSRGFATKGLGTNRGIKATMPSGLAALLDDVAGITKLAAASLDDISGAAGKAG